MKAPDKIYLDIRYNNDEYPKEVFATRALASDVEYIRKDALLEWAKAELSHAEANIEAYPYEDAYRGHREKIEELIAHIESL